MRLSLPVLALCMALFAGCGEDEKKTSAGDLDAALAVQAVANYCAEPESDERWQEKQNAVRDLLRLLRDDPEAAKDEAADAAGMLDDCGAQEDAARLDRALERVP